MLLVRHDHIAPDGPTVTLVRTAPFVGQYGCNFIRSQDGSSSERARGDEINGLIDPDTFKPTQMLVHWSSVDAIDDAGDLELQSNQLPGRDHRSQLQLLARSRQASDVHT